MRRSNGLCAAGGRHARNPSAIENLVTVGKSRGSGYGAAHRVRSRIVPVYLAEAVRQNESDSGDQKPEKKASGRAGAARKWLIASSGVVLLVVAVVAWVTHTVDRRDAEFQALYARLTGHAAAEARKRYESYEALAGSIGGLAKARDQDTGPDACPGHSNAKDCPSYYRWRERCRKRSKESSQAACAARGMLYAAVPASERWGIDVRKCPEQGSRPEVAVSDEAYFPVPVPHDVEQKRTVCLVVPLDKLITDPGTVPGSSAGEFDGVALADARDGKVLRAVHANPAVRLAQLPAYKKSLGDVPSESTVDLGPESYQVFYEPVEAEADLGAKKPVPLVVAGLVSSDRLARQAQQLPRILFLWAVAGLALIALCWPLGKLWLGGPNSRFTGFDVGFLVATSVVVLLFATVLLLAMTAHRRLLVRLDQQLQRSAEAVSGTLTSSLQASTDELYQFIYLTERRRELIARQDSEPGKNDATNKGKVQRERQEALPGCVLSRGRRRPSYCERADTPLLFAYQSRRLVGNNVLAFWADRSGTERIKWLAHRDGMPPVPVARREYFQQALDGKEAQLAPGLDGVPDVVRSLTSTQIVMIVARGTGRSRKGTTTGVAAVETEPVAFEHLALPVGTHFAVIRPNGTILLHSNNRAFHDHDFLEDFSRPQDVQARMRPEGGVANVEYRGTPSLLRMQRHESGWFVATVASKALVNATVLDSAVTTIAIMAFLLFLMGLLVLSVAWSRSFDPQRSPRRAFHPGVLFERNWPALAVSALLAGVEGIVFALLVPLPPLLQFARFVATALALALAVTVAHRRLSSWPWLRDNTRRYLVLAAVLAGLETAVEYFLLAGWRVGHEVLLVHAVVLAGSILVVLWLSNAPRRLAVARRYSLYCFCLAVGFVVAPSVMVFSGAYSAAVDGMLGIEQSAYANEMGLAHACGDDVHSGLAPDDQCSEIVSLGVPAGEGVCAVPQAGYPSSFSWLWPVRAFRKLLPHHVRAPGSVPSPGGAEAQATTPQWSVVRPGDCEESATPSNRWMVMFPGLVDGSDARRFGFYVLLFLGFLAAGDLVAHASVRRLFFTRIIDECRQAAARESMLKQRLEARETPRVLVVAPSKCLREQLEKDWNAIRIECKCSFERIRERIKQKGAIVVLADVDPVFITSGPAAGTQPAAEPAPMTDDWAELLKDFERLRGTGPRSPIATKAADRTTAAACEQAWASTGPDERRVLVQIAQHGFASPHPNNARTVERLACRGLIDPKTLAIENRTFGSFLLRRATREQLRKWEARETSLWKDVRAPLIAGMLIVLALLGYTQPDLAQTGTLLLPSVGAAMPLALRIIASLGERKD